MPLTIFLIFLGVTILVVCGIGITCTILSANEPEVIINKYRPEYPKKCECEHCGSLLRIEKRHIKGGEFRCPCCGKKSKVL